MPMMTRAGIAIATFSVNRVLISCEVSDSDFPIASSSGAWLNHTTKVTKNASQLRGRMLILPVKDNKVKRSLDMVGSGPFSRRKKKALMTAANLKSADSDKRLCLCVREPLNNTPTRHSGEGRSPAIQVLAGSPRARG